MLRMVHMILEVFEPILAIGILKEEFLIFPLRTVPLNEKLPIALFLVNNPVFNVVRSGLVQLLLLCML
mgnify:CR=1 FL=1